MKHEETSWNVLRLSEGNVRLKAEEMLRGAFIKLHRDNKIEPSVRNQYYVRRLAPSNWQIRISVVLLEEGDKTIEEIYPFDECHNIKGDMLKNLVEWAKLQLQQSEINRQMVMGVGK